MRESCSCSHFITVVALNYLWASESLVKLENYVFGGLDHRISKSGLRHMLMKKESLILENECYLKVGF